MNTNRNDCHSKSRDDPVRRKLLEEGRKSLYGQKARISVGMATCGQIAGAQEIYNTLAARNTWEGAIQVVKVGCRGACYAEPLVDVRLSDGTHYFYGKMSKKALWHVIRTAEGKPAEDHVWAIARERHPGSFEGEFDLEFVKVFHSGFYDFFKRQTKRVTARCGLINPYSLAEYVAADGYRALEKALFTLKPEEIIRMISDSGLRGRGGAGYPTGEKLSAVWQSPDPVRYVIANADEGDPGAYMDRALLESDPHAVIEGLIIACYAVKAAQAFIFIRREYGLALQTLRQALADAEEAGFLGGCIMGTAFNLDIAIVESAGSFVCGEETAMLQVLANQRGEPYPRPPYPSECGLRHHPTVINNVETLANIPRIVLYGVEAFRELGTKNSPGTKIFCLAGDIKRPGFIEVPLGTSSRAIVEDIGGTKGETLKAMQIGGPSGGIVAYEDIPLDYESLAQSGVLMGSGGLVAFSKSRCVVDLALHVVNFMVAESCGKCTICREGLLELEQRLRLLTIGKATENVLSEIEILSQAIAELSQCGLGKTSARSVLTSLRDFRGEYEAHVRGRCPAVVCKPLIDFEIVLPCRMCRACYIVCPSGAVTMREGKKRLVVDRSLCVKCWACYETCPFNFIKITSEEYEWNRQSKSR